MSITAAEVNRKASEVRPPLAATVPGGRFDGHTRETGWAGWYARHTFVVRPERLGSIESSPDFE
jgi:hypothetical protein